MKCILLDQPRINFKFRFTLMRQRRIDFAETDVIHAAAIPLLR